MSDIASIINELDFIAKNPAASIERFSKTKKGAFGIMPVYAPEELVHAAGYLPVGIWGKRTSISRSRAYLPPFTCSIMQSVMELQLNGSYDILKGVLFSVPCDTLKCMSQKWHVDIPSIVFTHPQNRKIEAANTFLAEELKIVRQKLEALSGEAITDAAINKSIDIYNKNRSVLRDFCELAAKYPDIINPQARHSIIKSRYFMQKEIHTSMVLELIGLLSKKASKPWEGKRVILTGILAEADSLLESLKALNIAVAADDLAQESRQFGHDVPKTDDPLLSLAKWWQSLDGCSLAADPLKPRGKMLVDKAKKYNADAVIVCMMKFCDPEEFDYPIYSAKLTQEGIKHLMLEIDMEAQGSEQLKTRLEAFSEIL